MGITTDLIIEILVFCIVVAVSITAVQEFGRVADQRRRLGGQGMGRTSAASVLQDQGGENQFFRWVESSSSISDPGARQKLRREMALAGFDFPSAPVWYVILRFSCAILLPTGFLLLQTVLPTPFTGPKLIVGALVLCGLGLIVPSSYVTRRAAARRSEFEFEFPDSLDLMVVCVEAGLGLDAAFVRVGQETRESHPLMSREFDRLTDELRAGRARSDALRGMAERTGVSAIRSFVALVIQSETLGAGISQTLRTFSIEMRQTRFMRAEEKAMRIPVLMTVPLVTCVLPVIITALLLPAILDVMRTLMPALAGHHGGG